MTYKWCCYQHSGIWWLNNKKNRIGLFRMEETSVSLYDEKTGNWITSFTVEDADAFRQEIRKYYDIEIYTTYLS